MQAVPIYVFHCMTSNGNIRLFTDAPTSQNVTILIRQFVANERFAPTLVCVTDVQILLAVELWNNSLHCLRLLEDSQSLDFTPG